MSGSNPRASLARCMSSCVYIGLADNIPVAAMGVKPVNIISGIGVIWMLSTDNVNHYRKEIINNAYNAFMDITKGYTTVYNYVHAENRLALRFLRFMGFTIHPPVTCGVAGASFHPVAINRE